MRKNMNYRSFGWAVGIILAVFLAAHLILNGQIREGRRQEEALRQTLVRLQEENTALDAELRQVDTEDYIVNSAMSNYAFMNKDDLRFQFTNPEALYAYTEEELSIMLDEMTDED